MHNQTDNLTVPLRAAPTRRAVGRACGMTLVEVLVAFTILTTIMLPVAMFMSQQFAGTNELSNRNQVLQFLDSTLEEALALPFSALPVGVASNTRLTDKEGNPLLDLSPHEIGGELVECALVVETVPVTFSVVTDPDSAETQQVHLDASMKRLTVQARWGKKQQHTLDLTAYKADL